jgi:hypothetical protein
MPHRPPLRTSGPHRVDARQAAVFGGGLALVAVLAAAALTPALLVAYGLLFNVETTFARMWPLVLLILSFATACVVLLLGLRVGVTRLPGQDARDANGALLTLAHESIPAGTDRSASATERADALQLTAQP